MHTLISTLTLLLVFITGLILQSQAQIVVTNPTSPWTVPAGITSIKVEVWGGGGGGGGVTAFWGTNGGGGGGGGAYNKATLTVVPGQTYTLTIGAGGTGGGSATIGGTGDPTTVSGTGGLVAANGGTGGGGGYFDNGIAGPAGSEGFSDGGNGGASSGNGSGGGGGAGNATPTGTGNGGAGSNTAAGSAGLGSPNSAPYAGGLGAAAKTSNGVGNSCTALSGGGSGGRSSFFDSNSGGAGAAGQVVITYTSCVPPSAPTTNGVNFCSGTSTTLSASDAVSGEVYIWYDASSGGTLLKTSTNNIDNTYLSAVLTSTTNYWVAILTEACGEGPRAMAIATVSNPVSTITSQTNITCNGGNDGSILIHASGGIAPYSYSVDNGLTWIPSETDPYPYGALVANTAYKIRVKDANNCTSPQIIP